jgi:pantoate--beta-alanine ligase
MEPSSPEGFFIWEKSMETIQSVASMKAWSRNAVAAGKTIGFVPTMGFLHEGHISLMRSARSENDLLVVSIFVNPTQFGRNEDFGAYPRDPESDSAKCAEVGTDALFMPEPDDIYGPYYQTYVDVEKVSGPLCGASRPGHFRGVATVVLKLFNIVQPTAAYFGRKDYQQLQVIKTMVKDLDLDVRIVPCVTLREEDGLAMSSRNSYLSQDERRQAVCLNQALLEAKRLFAEREPKAVKYIETMTQRINREPDAKIDYISLVHPETLQDLKEVNHSALAVMAVKVGKTRLIDNMVFERNETGTQ